MLTVNPDLSRGTDLRVVIEAKDRAVSGRVMRDELREARDQPLCGRGPGRVHAGPRAHRDRPVRRPCRRRLLRRGSRCPGAGDVLEAAVRLARLLAVATLQEREVEVDAAAIQAALTGHPRAAGARSAA